MELLFGNQQDQNSNKHVPCLHTCHFDYLDATMPPTIINPLCDIPLELAEENEASYKHPKRWQRIEDFQNDNEANNKTNYTKSELHKLVQHFFGTMEDIVKVPIPNTTSRYTFHREELLIYDALIKMKTGVTHTHMEEYITHSDARRCSYGYTFFLRYVDDRYAHVMDLEALSQWQPMFELFAEKI